MFLFARPRGRQVIYPLASIPSVSENGMFAQVSDPVSQLCSGRVKFNGVLWRAKCIHDKVFESGVTVRVLYRQGNTLMIDR